MALYCNTCGVWGDPSVVFCSQCGHPVDWIAHAPQLEGTRLRVVGRIAIAPVAPAATGTALVAAVCEALAAHPQAQSVAIFGYNHGDDTGQAYTRGVAEASRDGRGWAGDGRLQTGPLRGEDDGQIWIAIGHALAGAHVIMTFPRKRDDDETQPAATAHVS